MKKFNMFFVLCFLAFLSFTKAQAPQAFKYQAVARDQTGALLINKTISIKTSLLNGSENGTASYMETRSVTTNQYGLFNISIGEINPVTFATIEWGTDKYFLKVEIDPLGGTAYVTMGTSQLLSVPYALNAGSLTLKDSAGYVWGVKIGKSGLVQYCLTQPTSANAGPDQLNAIGTMTSDGRKTIALAANVPISGTGMWSVVTTGLGGEITTPTSPTSQFKGVPGIPYTLVWTISTCKFSSDTVVISFNNMTSVIGGTFTMGNAVGALNEKPAHSVTVSDILIGTFELTQAEYQWITGTNPNLCNTCYAYPVTNISWWDAIKYCNKRSIIDKLPVCYIYKGDTIPENWDNLMDYTQLLSNNLKGYRLPTEAEWEFAAKGGINSKHFSYSGSNTSSQVGWFSDTPNNGITTHPIGQLKANELVIYDMSGNVEEWTWDWYWYNTQTSYYQECFNLGTVINPKGPLTLPSSGDYRVRRIGSYLNPSVLVSSRNAKKSSFLDTYIGFRLCRTK